MRLIKEENNSSSGSEPNSLGTLFNITRQFLTHLEFFRRILTLDAPKSAVSRLFSDSTPDQTDSQVDASQRKFAKPELAYGLAMGGETDAQVGSQVATCVVVASRCKWVAKWNASWTQVQNLRRLASPFGQGFKADLVLLNFAALSRIAQCFDLERFRLSQTQVCLSRLSALVWTMFCQNSARKVILFCKPNVNKYLPHETTGNLAILHDKEDSLTLSCLVICAELNRVWHSNATQAAKLVCIFEQDIREFSGYLHPSSPPPSPFFNPSPSPAAAFCLPRTGTPTMTASRRSFHIGPSNGQGKRPWERRWGPIRFLFCFCF